MADRRVVRADLLDLVAHAREGFQHGGRETRLHLERIARLSPGAPEQPARRGDGRLRVAPEHRDAREDRALGLRLPVAAHVAVDEGAPVVQQRERGVERMEGLAARAQDVQGALVQHEAAAAVLPVDAGLAQHHAAAILVVQALDEAHRAPRAVDDAEPHGIAGPAPGAPRRCAGAIDACGESPDAVRREKLLRLDLHVRGIRHVAIAHPECLLRRLDAQVHVVRAVGIDRADAQGVEDTEDQQRDHALGRRRDVVEASQRMAQRERRAPPCAMRLEVPEHQGTAGDGELPRHRAREVAGVEIAQPRARQPLERRGKRRVAESRSGRGRVARDEEGRVEARLAA